jgi:hypothetical protein
MSVETNTRHQNDKQQRIHNAAAQLMLYFKLHLIWTLRFHSQFLNYYIQSVLKLVSNPGMPAIIGVCSVLIESGRQSSQWNLPNHTPRTGSTKTLWCRATPMQLTVSLNISYFGPDILWTPCRGPHFFMCGGRSLQYETWGYERIERETYGNRA